MSVGGLDALVQRHMSTWRRGRVWPDVHLVKVTKLTALVRDV